jgi:hypothetical protein
MAGDSPAREPAQLRALRAELGRNPALVDAILSRSDLFPPVPPEPERAIWAARQNAERAICRALARTRVWREVWRIEIVE